jgi:putative hydrolase of the HAD superfamily
MKVIPWLDRPGAPATILVLLGSESSMNPQIVWAGIEGIVLDAVGTLIEPVPSVADAYLAVARSQGIALDRSLVRSRFRDRFQADEEREAAGSLVTDEANEHQRWRGIVADVLPELTYPETAFAELWNHFGRSEAWRCFPDVAPALETLVTAGIRLSIASNFDARLRRVVAGLTELSSYRDSLVISAEVGLRKPHPGFYRAACTSLGLSGDHVLFVGDDLENDVLGARRSGSAGALVDRAETRSGDLPRFSSLTELVTGLSSR